MDCDKCELYNSCINYKIWCERNMRNPEYYKKWSQEKEFNV